ncbi:MAG: hypothetical protein HY326_06095, partial [Chloroflexi bacterium]|nr:hypothetical protein [Chloroflexota bacterium]
MVSFWYEDIFIAFPGLFRTPMGEKGRRWKMLGHNQVGLAYSYNGTYWLRPYHDPFLPIGEPGTFGGGINGPGSMVLGDDQVLRIYTTGYKPQHNQGNAYQQYRASGQEYGAMLIYNLRKDGFAYLEPMGGWGWVKTKTLLPQDGQLELNIQAPLGEVLVQVSDEASEPIPGFTFEDAIPIQGDGVAIRPQWKEHRLDELTGKPCRLEFKLFSARLFAYRWNCQVYYAKEAQDRV